MTPKDAFIAANKEEMIPIKRFIGLNPNIF